MAKGLVITSQKEQAEIIQRSLASEMTMECADGFLPDAPPSSQYEFVFVDISYFPSASGPHAIAGSPPDFMGALRPFLHQFPSADILVLASQERLRDAVEAVKAGAANYVTYPISTDELKYVLDSLREHARFHSELAYLRDRFWKTDSIDLIRSNHEEMRAVVEKIRAVAPTRTTVLLLGETGTGKGVMARLIHRHSNRADRQFISVHCGAIPEPLLESELFGYEKGAFTGATRRKLGKFEVAHGGTLFLDEVATMSQGIQVKLLQILQDKTFQRLGGTTTISTDVRIIAATNEDLDARRLDGSFRSDLYYRLSIFPICLPPLRERLLDLPILVERMLKKLNENDSKGIEGVHPAVMEAFNQYSWPGNIRELENLIERAYILEEGPLLSPSSFPSEIMNTRPGTNPVYVDTTFPLAEVRRRAADEMERRYLRQLLAEQSGSIKGTAKMAGITERQLHKLMLKHRLRKELFKSEPTPRPKSGTVGSDTNGTGTRNSDRNSSDSQP